MKTVHAQYLKDLGVQIFIKQGLEEERAEFLAHTLVEANLTGHDSHGVTYYSAYSNRIKEGHIDVKADPKTVKETPASALVDGEWAPGQVTAIYAMELAVKKARENAVGAVGAYNCNHIGRVGYYTNWAAERGIIAMMFVNVGNPSATVFNGTIQPPTKRLYSLHIKNNLNLKAMQKCLNQLEGTHDFSSFENSGSRDKNKSYGRGAIRTLSKASLTQANTHFLVFEFTGDGFLRHMVRNLVGTILESGRGRLSVDTFKAVLDAKDRSLAGATAPPQGLSLIKVFY